MGLRLESLRRRRCLVLLVSQEPPGGAWGSQVWLSPALVPQRGSLEGSREKPTAVVRSREPQEEGSPWQPPPALIFPVCTPLTDPNWEPAGKGEVVLEESKPQQCRADHNYRVGVVLRDSNLTSKSKRIFILFY